MAERRSFFGRLFTGLANLFRGARPPPTPVPEAEPPPTAGPFGFPPEEEAYPVEPEMFPEQPEPYRGGYAPAGQLLVQGNDDYWHTKEFWFNEVTTKDAATLEAEYGVNNIDIIRMLEVQSGGWIGGSESPDWQAFRDEYARQFGYSASKFSPQYGR